jgi:hypothetical protein
MGRSRQSNHNTLTLKDTALLTSRRMVHHSEVTDAAAAAVDAAAAAVRNRVEGDGLAAHCTQATQALVQVGELRLLAQLPREVTDAIRNSSHPAAVVVAAGSTFAAAAAAHDVDDVEPLLSVKVEAASVEVS